MSEGDRVVQCRICEWMICYAEWGRNTHDVEDTCLCEDGAEREVNAVDMLAEVGKQFIALEKDIGRSVVYTPYEGAKTEDGVITGVNDQYVFVRYGADKGSKATRPEDLKWLAS
jgi:hypothetical protein